MLRQIFETREAITFENGSEKLFGVFHRPLDLSFFPTVLIFHGLAGNKTGRFRVYVEAASELAKRGFGVLRFDFRGSGDSEGFFSEISIDDLVSDALKALTIVKDIPGVDPERIGVFGRSFGGIMAILAAIEDPTIKSLALWAPMFSSQQWVDRLHLYRQDKIKESDLIEMMSINGQPGTVPFFEKFFTLHMEEALSKIGNIPLLHIHGEADNYVNISHAEGYEKVRNRTSTLSRFVRLPASDHDFSNRRERLLAIEETCKWFEDTL